MSEPMFRMHVDLKVFGFEMTVRTVHIVAACLGAAAIVAASGLQPVPARQLPPPTGTPELDPVSDDR